MKQDRRKIFCKCKTERHNNKSFDCADADMIIAAINDAKNEMSYSNWANDKFDRAIRLVQIYCKAHKIPMRFVGVRAKKI